MFNHSDLVCKHCGELGNNKNADKLLININEFQKFLGPAHLININSAYRCKEYNRELYKRLYRTSLAKKIITLEQLFRKADSSQHIKTLAVDIKILFYQSEMMRKMAIAFNRWHAIGIYNTFIHCDLRIIRLRTWDSRSKDRKKSYPI